MNMGDFGQITHMGDCPSWPCIISGTGPNKLAREHLMKKIILVYGCLAGVIIVASLALSMAAGAHGGVAGMAVGYLSMLIALSLVFVGVKKYRDEQLGGVIRFSTALGVGFGISLIATLFYALGWEAYLYATDYRFMPEYIASVIDSKRAAGASAAEIAKLTAEMQDFAMTYANPLMRMLISMSEIAPVAVAVTVVSATLLRKPNFMQARAN
jgi:Protein of unknown function (DUF4199)